VNCDLRRDWVSIKGALEDGEGRRKTSAIFLYFFNIHSFEYREEIDLPLSQRLRALYSCVSRLLFCGRLFFNLFSVQTCNTASAANLRCGFPCFRDDTIVVPVVLQSAILVPPCTPES